MEPAYARPYSKLFASELCSLPQAQIEIRSFMKVVSLGIQSRHQESVRQLKVGKQKAMQRCPIKMATVWSLCVPTRILEETL